MPHYVYDPLFWFLTGISLVWIYRGTHALRVLQKSPWIYPQASSFAAPAPKVSIIIPARNEASNIGDCIDSLLRQTYPDYEIIIVNDRSTDGTEEILKSYAGRIRYFNVEQTPPGWTGKNYAIHSCMHQANGDWLLFSDADTRHEPESLAASLAHAIRHRLGMLTLLPRCLTSSFLERVLQPCMMGYTGLWFPLKHINDPSHETYFANGQFILMTKHLYQKIGGHEKVYDAFLEDFALMENAKKLGERVQCAMGVNIYGTRMYPQFSSMWRGWRRIFLHAFRKDIPLLLEKMLDVLIAGILPFVIYVVVTLRFIDQPQIHGPVWIAANIALGLIFITCYKTYQMLKAPARYFWSYPFAALACFLILLNAVWVSATKGITKWR